MVYPASEILIVNDDEFLLLLAASGLEKWYGTELSGQHAALDDIREFNSRLASLYRKGVVEWAGERAEIAEAYKALFRALRDADKCILVKDASRPGRIKGCYCSGGSIVNVERGPASVSEVELSLQSVSDWISELEASDCLPEPAEVPEEGEELLGAETLLSEFELRSVPDGRLIQTVRFFEQGLYATKEILEGTVSSKGLYRPGDAKSILTGWCGGEI